MMIHDQHEVLSEAVIERLLLSKAIIGPFRVAPSAQPDRQTLASHVLASHDAAELALAAIAEQLDAFPKKPQVYLMDFFPKLKECCHKDRDVAGKQFFNQLNRVRISLKHHGVFPDPQQWCRVASRTYDYISDWCSEYLGTTLEDLDYSELLRNEDVKKLYSRAKTLSDDGHYRESIEMLSYAEHALFRSNAALRGLSVGEQKAEDALKLSAYGVHANEFLALQEFLPALKWLSDGSLQPKPDQSKFDHPGNWRAETADFCLRTFVSIALRIQNAPWIPGAVHFSHLYDHLMTALRDGVEIWNKMDHGFMESKEKTVNRVLNKGESLRGKVMYNKRSHDQTEDEPLTLFFLDLKTKIFGNVYANHVEVKCVPQETEFVQKYFPDLPVISADLEEE